MLLILKESEIEKAYHFKLATDVSSSERALSILLMANYFDCNPLLKAYTAPQADLYDLKLHSNAYFAEALKTNQANHQASMALINNEIS